MSPRRRLLCGDARNADHVACLMGGAHAAMAFLDPPYNVRVRDIVGRGQVKHNSVLFLCEIRGLKDGRPAIDLRFHELAELRWRALALGRDRSAELGELRRPQKHAGAGCSGLT